MTCVFCDRLSHGELLAVNEHAAAFRDAFPLTDGHCLVIPRRHEPDFFALTADERSAMWDLLSTIRHQFNADRPPDGFNIGINVGEAAGQTVFHAHLHLIPRYRGDVPDPRGGVRCVIPGRARYWETR